MDERYDGSSGGRTRGMKLLLAVSLAFNLVFTGLVAGALLRHHSGGHAMARVHGLGTFGTPYMMALSGPERRGVLQEIRNSGDTGLPSREKRQEMFRDVLGSLRAQPFDPDDLRDALSRQAAVSIAVQKRAQQAWINTLTGMDDRERADYAKALEEVLALGGRRH